LAPRALPERRDLLLVRGSRATPPAAGRRARAGRDSPARPQRAPRELRRSRPRARRAARLPEADVRVGLRGRMVAASVLLALIVAGAFTLLLLAITNLDASANRARHSEQVIANANQLERLVIDMETGQRGFVITRDERFLEPWLAARKALPAQERSLTTLVRDNPLQHRRAAALTAAIHEYLANYSIPLVEAARTGGSRASEIVATGNGKRRVDAIRRQFDRLAATERALSAARSARADANAHRALALGFGGLGLSVFLILAFGCYLTRIVVAPIRRLAGAARDVSRGDLGARVAEAGSGEVLG